VNFSGLHSPGHRPRKARLRRTLRPSLLTTALAGALIVSPLAVPALAYAAPSGGATAGSTRTNQGSPVTTAAAAPADCTDKPLVEDFGVGTDNPPLPDGETTYAYQAAGGVPSEGSYRLSSLLRLAAFPGGPDHTSGDTDGRMMVLNASAAPGTFFSRTVTGLEVGKPYGFSAWIASLNRSTYTLLPNVRFRVVDPDTGAVLATRDSGDIGNTTETGIVIPMEWHQFELGFTATQSAVRLELVNNATGPDGIGNQIALDDIGLSPACDYGDAPDSYGTLSASDGPVHGRGAPHLGATVDYEGDGQPTTAADGDDADGSDDGLVFNPQLGYPDPTIRTGLDPITLEPVANHVTVNASAVGFASMWVDWNGDGDFLDPDEQVADATPVTAGENDVTFSHTDNPPDSRVYVRVRYSTDANSIHAPTGPAPDGEVEDYQVLAERLILPAACAPVSEPFYAMTFNSVTDKVGDGAAPTSARYPAVTVVDGQLVDMLATTAAGGSTINSQGFTQAGDDASFQLNASGSAVAFTFSFVKAGTTTPIAVNGVWTVNDMDNGERAQIQAAALTGYAVTPGSQVSVVTSDPNFVDFRGTVSGNGAPESRFQVWFQGITSLSSIWRGFGNSGFALDGDGDVPLPQSCDDYGDAPDTYGTTDAADGPHHHVTSALRLGADSEFDADGQPTAGADGDDTNRNDDEDGVSAPIIQTSGRPTPVTVSAANNLAIEATLAGWIDLNDNGTFDAGERQTVPVPASSGTADYTLSFPAPTALGRTYARLRLLPGSPADPRPTGPATAGEVEDYPVTTRALTVTKTSDATPDSKPGDVLHYSVTLTNSGTADYTTAEPAAVVDDLSEVLDDATYDDDASADRGSAPTYASPRVAWSGPLAADDTMTLTYSVTVKGGGDGHLTNVAWQPADPASPGPAPDCSASPQPCATTSLDLPKLSITKTADRSDLPAIGQDITYQVVVSNTGPGDYTADHPATFTDDLSKVLDDATSGTITATTGSAAIQGTSLTWTGELAHGESATIAYAFTYEGTGDGLLLNTACVPTAEALTAATHCDSVSVPGTGEVEDWKSVDPASGTTVKAGATLTYTLHFANVGAGPVSVAREDDLSGVLDDATLVAGPTASSRALAVTRPSAGRLAIAGSLPPGTEATVRYTVRVKPDGSRGDNRLQNFLVDPGQHPSASCSATGPAADRSACTFNPIANSVGPIAPPGFDLRLVKTLVGGRHRVVGDTVRYRLVLSNLGLAAARAPFVVRDALPAGLQLRSAHGRGWRCQVKRASDVVRCGRSADLRGGRKAAAIVVVARVTAKAVGRVVNVATVRAPGDVAPGNNRAKAAMRVTKVPALPDTGYRYWPGGLRG
jgi:uncharacterized repeat protein (TIGR01451 family)/fimbrial isopeptide formation D2 family protein